MSAFFHVYFFKILLGSSLYTFVQSLMGKTHVGWTCTQHSGFLLMEP